MNNEYRHQQGDVQLFAATIPDDALEVFDHGGILAEGEVTGHAHRMIGPVRLFEAGDDVYMRAPKRITLAHEEHGTQTVEPGTYRIGRVQEYDYDESEARDVND